MIALVAGVSLGLASSVHCALMCGPLMGLTLGRRGGARAWRDVWAQLARSLWHHAGRVLVYVLLGAVAGSTEVVLRTQGLRSTLAVVAGLTVIAAAVVSLRPGAGLGFAGNWAATIGAWIGRLSARLPRQRLVGRIALGVLHGFLPCGLLYLALLAAVGFGSRTAAATFMLGFGLATIPALAGLGSMLVALQRAPVAMRRAAPIATALVGILLVARGLGVPGLAAHGTHAMVHTHVTER